MAWEIAAGKARAALTTVFVVYGLFTSLADDIVRVVFMNGSCNNYHVSSTEF